MANSAQSTPHIPGPVALFGSGETSPSGQRIFNKLFKRITASPQVALLETPAGFELNSPRVAGKVAEFLEVHLKNYHPSVQVVPARKKGTAFSPDDPQIVEPLLHADLIFMGPGSPSYAVRQLQDSLAWEYLAARHRLGAGIALASAASIAASVKCLPVYEIYKVGQDIHWIDGLDLFGLYGLELVIVPHWNNTDGGDELDTSRCFMGLERFNPLMDMLPPSTTVLGIDEQSGVIIDFAEETFEVVGKGSVTVVSNGSTSVYGVGKEYPLSILGEVHLPEPETQVDEDHWQTALQADRERQAQDRPPEAILAMIEEREAARQARDWASADRLRDEIQENGWVIMDTDDGPSVERR
jgi:cyanophycinase-like exopeptidase